MSITVLTKRKDQNWEVGLLKRKWKWNNKNAMGASIVLLLYGNELLVVYNAVRVAVVHSLFMQHQLTSQLDWTQ